MNEADDWIDPSAPTTSAPATPSGADDWITPAATAPQGFSDRLSADLSNAGDEAVKKLQNPNLNSLGRAAIDAQTGLNAMWSVPKEGAVSAYQSLPESVKSGVASGGDYLKNKAAEAWGALPEGTRNEIASDASAAAKWVSGLVEEHPNIAGPLGVAASVAPAVPLVKGAGAAAEMAGPEIKRMIEEGLPSPKDLLKNEASGNPDVIPSPSMGPRSYPDVREANKALSTGTSSIYDRAHELGMTFTPEGNQFAVNKIQEDVGKLYDKLHTQTSGAMNYFVDEATENGLNLKTLDDARKKFNLIAYDSTANSNDISTAKKAIKSIDSILDAAQENPGLLEGGTPDSVGILKLARASSSLEQRHSTISDIMRTSNGDANKIQASFKKIYDDEDEFSRFSPQNQKVIEAIAHPGKLMKVLQGVGTLGMGQGNTGAIPAEIITAFLGHPIGAGTAFGVGTAANITRNELIKRGADSVLRNLERNAGEINSLADGAYSTHLDNLFDAQSAGAGAAKPTLALPSGEPNRPMIGGRGQPLRPASDEEWQNMIEQQKADKASGMSETRKAQQKKAVSDYAKDHPESGFFKNAGDKPIKSSETGLDTEKLGLEKNPFHKGDGFPDEEGNFARGGAIKVNTDPTPAQKMAGNYKKAHVKFHGLDISIENPKGSTRKGKGKDGKEWQSTMPDHYGYIKRTQGADDDHIDVYLGENKRSNRVYVIDQKDHATGKFDEHKCMLGYGSREEATAAYRSAFSDKKDRIMRITRLSIQEFKDWLKAGNTRQPLKKVA